MSRLSTLLLLVSFICLSYTEVNYCQDLDTTSLNRLTFIEGLPKANIQILKHLAPEEYHYSSIQLGDLNDVLFVIRNKNENLGGSYWLVIKNEANDYEMESLDFTVTEAVFPEYEYSIDNESDNVAIIFTLDLRNNFLYYKIRKNKKAYLNFNLVIESFLLYTEGFSYKYYDYRKETVLYPVSIYADWEIIYYDSWNMEFRAGILYGGYYFEGWEAGIFYKRNFSKKFFTSFGTVVQFKEESSHKAIIYDTIRGGAFFKLGISAGYNVFNDLYLILSYYKTLNEDYGYGHPTDYRDEMYKRNLYSIIKFGLLIDI